MDLVHVWYHMHLSLHCICNYNMLGWFQCYNCIDCCCMHNDLCVCICELYSDDVNKGEITNCVKEMYNAC